MDAAAQRRPPGPAWPAPSAHGENFPPPPWAALSTGATTSVAPRRSKESAGAALALGLAKGVVALVGGHRPGVAQRLPRAALPIPAVPAADAARQRRQPLGAVEVVHGGAARDL